MSGCAVDAPTGALLHPEALTARGSGGGPTVSATTPSYARQGDVQLAVQVTGSGFAPGAKATWLLAGDSTQVVTNSTTYISATELQAVITVSPTASLAYYDVAVTNPGGKKGVGVELFAITTAQVLGAGTIDGDAVVLGMNDLGHAVGYAAVGSAFVFDGTSMVSLGSNGQAWGIDPSGDVVVGRNASSSRAARHAVAWNRTGVGAYVEEYLPRPSNAGNSIARKVVRAPSGDLLAAGAYQVALTKTTNRSFPALWTRHNGTWQSPTEYVTPGVSAYGWDLSRNGQMIGSTTLGDGSVKGVIWETSTTFTLLNDITNAINDAGTLVVGLLRSGGPGFWYRDPATGLWNPTPIPLPVGDPSCTSEAQDVNDAGIIVGYGCPASSQKKVGMGIVWRLNMAVTPPALVGEPQYLMGLSSGGVAKTDAISNVAPYIIVGEAQSTPRRLAVRWPVP